MVSTLANAGFLAFSMVCSIIMVVSLANDVTLEFTPIWPNALVISVALAVFFIFLVRSS